MFATIFFIWILTSITTAACAAFFLGRLSELDSVAAFETTSPKIIVLSEKMIHLQSVS